MPHPDLQTLVEYLVKGLLEKPEAATVRVTERDRIVMMEIRVSAEEMGKIIGRRGRVIGAIRTLVKAAAARSGRRVVVEVVE